MHIPDGFFDAGTSAAGGAVAVGGLGVAVRRTRQLLTERQVPLAALVASFVFAVQMLNFPVASGTSGHLLGGALAAVLVGPWVGAIALSVVLVVQLLFADGGVTALGLNIAIVGLVTSLGGWVLFRGLRAVLPARRESVVVASGVAAFLTVPLAAAVFTGAYAVGGTASIPVGGLAVAMVGTHVLIGVGEGVITALTVGSVLAARPDLVAGAHDLVPALVAGAGDPSSPASPDPSVPSWSSPSPDSSSHASPDPSSPTGTVAP